MKSKSLSILIAVITLAIGMSLGRYLFYRTKYVKIYRDVAIKDTSGMLKKNVLNGDKRSYNQLVGYFGDKEDLVSLLPWALVMSSKYNYARAHYDVYMCYSLMSYSGIDSALDDIGTENKSIALMHLKKAAEMNDQQAVSEYNRINKNINK